MSLSLGLLSLPSTCDCDECVSEVLTDVSTILSLMSEILLVEEISQSLNSIAPESDSRGVKQGSILWILWKALRIFTNAVPVQL